MKTQEYPNLANLHDQLRTATKDPAMKGAKEMEICLPWADWVAIKAELRKVLLRTAQGGR